MKNIEYYKSELKECIDLKNMYDIGLRNGLKEGFGTPIGTDFINWLLAEYVTLTKEEKEYLSTVIKPFRNDVKFIYKGIENYQNYICLGLTSDREMKLPYYDDKSYRNMTLGKEYTLEELGL